MADPRKPSFRDQAKHANARHGPWSQVSVAPNTGGHKVRARADAGRPRRRSSGVHWGTVLLMPIAVLLTAWAAFKWWMR